MTSFDHTSDIARQERYLARLPENYDFPLFNSEQALQSQRRNGYRNTAVAAREIVDNALEAGATEIDILFQRPQRLGKHERKDSVAAIAFIDNGSGIIPKMARYALSWGGGSHFDDHDFIGKFGFGLPNASINQTKVVHVFTKVETSPVVHRVSLDIAKFSGYGVQSIPEPIEAELPEFVQRHLEKKGQKFEHGTVVIWDRPDRLSYRQVGNLKPHILDDFGAAYRNFLADVKITLDGTEVSP